jgi:mersacidin/lichenicidin family type 2 lantibiotic
MSHEKTIRAWKDEDFRLSLSEAEIAQLPGNPAGLVELTEEQLGVVGGASVPYVSGCCSMGCPSLHCHTVTK